MEKYEAFKILENIETKEKFIFIIIIIIINKDILIELPNDFKMSLEVKPTLQRLKNLGYIVKGSRYLSQLNGLVKTELFILI